MVRVPWDNSDPGRPVAIKPLAGASSYVYSVAARLLTWRAAWMARHGNPFTRAGGSMSKLVARHIGSA